MKKTTEANGRQSAQGTSAMLSLWTTILCAIIIFISSCSKRDSQVYSSEINNEIQDTLWKTYPLDTIPDGLETARTTAYPTSSYVSVPGIGEYQSAPGSSVSYNGTTYYKGPFLSAVGSVNGSSISFIMKRTDGLSFPSGSVLRVKLTNAGGTVVGTRTLTSSATTVSISISEATTWNLNGGSSTNSNNSKNYVATWYNPASGYNFYTKPIRIVAVPMGWGTYLASFNGVNVYSNGWGGFSATDYLTDTWGQKYQCVHYIKRYYKVVKNKTIGPGNAIVYWQNYNSVGLSQRVNNGAGIPRAGDIICFKSTSGSYHVGIVGGVVSGKLRVYQENVGQSYSSATGTYCSGYKDFSFTSNSSGYTVSASMLGSSWTTLGWVR